MKISIWSAMVVTTALMIMGILTLIHVYLEQVEAVDEHLRGTTKHFIAQFKQSGRDISWLDANRVVKIFHPGVSPQRFVEIATKDGSMVYRSPNLSPSTLTNLPKGFSHLRIQGLPVRVYVTSGEGIHVSFAMDMVEVHDVLSELALGYLIALPFLLATIYFGGQLIAHKALEPLRQLTVATEQINVQRLSQRIPTTETPDEIGRMSTVLNEIFNRLDISFKQALRFSADASHELKTPLTILRASLENLLAKPQYAGEIHEDLASLLEQTIRLTSIIENLLLLSRVDAGKLKLDLHPQNISEIISVCVEDVRIMSASQDILIDEEVPPALWASVDKLRLMQVMLNLLDNALKYNMPNGRIQIRAVKHSDHLRVTVANTSLARLEEHQSRLFERFYRVEHRADEPGSGLGLSLARELTRAHHGELTFVRSDGQWTEFAITLPANLMNEAMHDHAISLDKAV